MKKSIIIFIVLLSTFFFLFGTYIDDSRILSILISDFSNAQKNSTLQNNPNAMQFNYASVIDIESELDIFEKRNDVIKYIWNDNKLPDTIPTSIENNISDDRFNDITNLKQIDKFSIKMKHNFVSNVYLFIPEIKNNHLILYHQGHADGFILGKPTIDFFLKNGFSVAAFSMPLVGMNNQPIINIESTGPVKFIEHKQFRMLETESFSPISYFFTPITSTLNYLEKNYSYDYIHMIGISGGGWTTTIYPALDTRTSDSYAVSGSLPLSLRSISEDIGDYEQINYQLYKISNYLEFYVMSSYGDDRKFTQIFNKFDPCCFAGTLYTYYEDSIKQKINQLGKGDFVIFLDDSHKKHEISELARNYILEEINQ